MRLAFVLLLGLCALGCARTAPSDPPPLGADVITVEGRLSVRGNAPFTMLMLTTDQHNLYVVELDDAERQAVQPFLPARYRITGVVYRADVNGRPYAHLRARLMEQQ